jgi:hypothetical protein
MDDVKLLRQEFIAHGKKQGLEEAFLIKILDYLLENQFLPAGERGSIRDQLSKMIRAYSRGD